MATKTTKTRAAKKSPAQLATPGTVAPKKVAQIVECEKPDEARALADLALRPSVNAALVLRAYSTPVGELDTAALALSLSEEVNNLWAGDMKRAEAMLITQAQALQGMFMHLARRAANQDQMKHYESFFRMGLKAQNQCRMTLETLALLKNPPVVFAKQANINNGGQQQVNNGGAPPSTPARTGTHAQETKSDQPELLEANHGQRLDTRAQGQASGADPILATVGKIHRPAKR
jgi:hypothetical protein